jgi:hypothetical protein
MYNLIQTMDAIRGLPTQDVMKYANGTNPDVPAYLALAELNRRKQVEDTSSAFYGQQPTVKEQIESSLTGAPTGQVNPAAPPMGQVNPTQMAPQLAPSMTAPSKALGNPQVNIAGTPTGQVAPNAAPPMPMAEGGLSSLPLPHMFRQSSYVNGGIVAFADGTEDKTVRDAANARQMEQDREGFLGGLKQFGAAAADILTLPQRAAAGVVNTGIRGARAVTGVDIPYLYGDSPDMVNSMTPYYDHFIRKPEEKAKADATKVTASDVEDAEAGAAMRNQKTQPNAVPTNPNKQASATSSGQVRPPAFNQNAAMADLTDEQLFARRQKLNELAGVSNDPMADIKKRYAAIEARRAGQEADDPYNRTIERLASFATAAPEKGFGYQAAISAQAGAKMEQEQNALRDKQATEMATLQGNIAKEDDARKRGDVKGVEEARAAQQKNKMDLAELEVKRMTAQAHMISAGKPSQYSEMIALAKRDPELFAKMQGQSKSGMMTLEEAYKSVTQDPMNATLTEEQKRQKAKELYNWASSSGAQTGGPAVGTVVKGADGSYKFKGGDPNNKANWEKV